MTIGGHQSAAMQSDVWLTPPEILGALGPFDLDPCAVDDPRPWPTAARHIVRAENGLLQRWLGRVWLNPPYGAGIAAWMARMADHGHGTALVFARTETEWFFQSVWRAASAVLFIEGRLNFHFSTGERAPKNAGAPNVLIAYGIEDCDRLAGSGLAGAFVPLPHGQAVAVCRGPAVTWRWLLRQVLAREGGVVRLNVAYLLVQRHPKAAANANWQAKVRQVFQGPDFERVGQGTYRLRGVA